jgi:hypothetical protein
VTLAGSSRENGFKHEENPEAQPSVPLLGGQQQRSGVSEERRQLPVMNQAVHFEFQFAAVCRRATTGVAASLQRHRGFMRPATTTHGYTKR